MNAALLTLMPLLAGSQFDAERLRMAGLVVICLILSVTIHEFAHAYAAHKLGDGTPEAQGRLTLSPMAHADPVGTLILPLLMGVMNPAFLFGWGRPVQTEPRNYTRKITMRGGMAIVAFAGPLSNLLQAGLTLAVVAGLSAAGVFSGATDLLKPFEIFFSLNVLLFLFNLLPIHPLDGGKVLSWAFGPRFEPVDDFLRRYGGIILIVLVLSRVLGYLLGPVMAQASLVFRAVL
ncbi:MAG: site-2 protease family protein [Nannocystales bacterium]